MPQAATANITYRTTRHALEEAIEAAIAALDDLDGDTDLEPSLAGSDTDREHDETDPATGGAW